MHQAINVETDTDLTTHWCSLEQTAHIMVFAEHRSVDFVSF